MQIPLQIDSLRRRVALVLLLLALLAIVVSGLWWWQKVTAALLAGMLVYWQHRRQRQTDQWQTLQYRPAGQWSLLDADHNEANLDLLPQQFISPWLIIVHARAAVASRGRVLHLWLWRHQIDTDLYRKIAVNIKYNQLDRDDI